MQVVLECWLGSSHVHDVPPVARHWQPRPLLRTAPLRGHAGMGGVADTVIDLQGSLYPIRDIPEVEIRYRTEPRRATVQIVSPAVTHEAYNARNLALNNSLLLIGYDQQRPTRSPGHELRAALYWHVNERSGEGYHSYLHLVDERGNVIAQSDHRPGRDYYQPSKL